jgi:hypothetical protein
MLIRNYENVTYRVYTHTADLIKCSEDLGLDSAEYFSYRT